MDGEHRDGVKGERALRAGDADRLGFSEVATRIANSLVDRASEDGFVVGIDGQWGSGKSSLLYLITERLRAMPEATQPTVLSFQPWLVGDRDALLNSLFTQLAVAIESVQYARGDATGTTKRKAKEAAELLRSFGSALSKAGELIEVLSGWAGLPQLPGKIIRSLGAMTGRKKDTRLDALKEKLTAALRDLGHRFIITVDDVDRLEPREVVELLRLVRSVADFPSVVYVLCYDSAILAEGIVRGADVPDGVAFLEKIVQLTVMVPRPESFQLRNWFADEVAKIVSIECEQQRRRLRSVIDQEGGLQLRTPRSVVRTLDSVRFFWPALEAEKIDVADLIWLLLVKDGAPKLYRWVEGYLIGYATVALRIGQVSKVSAENELRSLHAIAGEGYFRDVHYRHFFAEQLPGVRVNYGDDGEPLTLFEEVGQDERNQAIAGRRLASPDHHRLYLALIGPTHAISQVQVESFWNATRLSAQGTADAFRALANQFISSEMSKLDLMLERLRGSGLEHVEPAQAENILLALGAMMDEADVKGSNYSFMVFTSWDRAERLVGDLLRRVLPERRGEVIDALFAAPALGWLTSLYRAETFAHGHYGEQKKPNSEWILTEDEYQRVVQRLTGRYRELTAEQIFSTSRPLHILFAWGQGGDAAEPKELIAQASTSDEGFLEVLGHFISTTNTDKGVSEVIRRDTLQYFMDYDEALARVDKLAKQPLSTSSASALSRVRSALRFRSR